MIRTACIAWMLLWSLPAAAQEIETAPGDAPRPQAESDPYDDVWSEYHRAESELRKTASDDARRALQALITAHRDHPAAAAAQALLAQPHPTEDQPPAAPAARPTEKAKVEAPDKRDLGEILRDEKPTLIARGELGLGQTVMGAALGASLCALAGCNDVRPIAASALLFAGTGLTLSLVLTQDGITPGHALALNDASAWGYWNAIGLTYGVSRTAGNGAIGGALATGQLVGLGLGEIAYRVFRPSAGDVSLSLSGGVWSIVLVNLFVGAAGSKMDSQSQMLLSVAVGDLGFLSAALLASAYPMSRTRTILIDLGGIVGVLLGLTTGELIGGKDADTGLIYGTTAIGTIAGLISTAILTRGWDTPDLPIQVGVAPTRGGAQLFAGLSL